MVILGKGHRSSEKNPIPLTKISIHLYRKQNSATLCTMKVSLLGNSSGTRFQRGLDLRSPSKRSLEVTSKVRGKGDLSLNKWFPGLLNTQLETHLNLLPYSQSISRQIRGLGARG